MSNTVLSPYDRLLLAAISEDRERRLEACTLLQTDRFDWKEAFYVAESNRLAVFVARLLEEEQIRDLVDDEVQGRWQELKSELEGRSARALAQVHEVGELLSEVGVTPLLYKGPDFQVRCYGDSGPRSFGDIDIIIRKAESDVAAGALRRAGYSQPPGAPSLDYYRRFHLHAIYLHPEFPKGLPLELHWALDSPYSHLPDIVPALLEVSERCDEFGSNVLRPSALDALALMVVHLEKHLGLAAALPDREARIKAVIEGFGMVWVLDVLKWLQHHASNYDGETILSRMRELAAERALVIALRLVSDIDPAVLPGWARDLAERLPHGRPWISRVIYPDLSAGQGSTAKGKRRRSFLYGDLPGLGFRPVRLVEALLPNFRVPDVDEAHASPTIGARLRRVALGGANILAILSWKLRGSGEGEAETAAPR